MANQGNQFEWAIYHIIAVKLRLAGPQVTTAKTQWKTISNSLRHDGAKAIKFVESAHGKIIGIDKISGGDEPKTDLIIKTERRKLRCSLKYGGSFQLSSAGINRTVQFLSSVVESVRKLKGYNKQISADILGVLAEIDESYGDLGKMPASVANKRLGEGEHYNDALKQLLGTSRNPQVAAEYDIFKMAIIREAMTGEFTFPNNKDKVAEYILSEKGLVRITDTEVRKVADKTSVRLALKGRGSSERGKKIVRLNEIVIRFDSKA